MYGSALKSVSQNGFCAQKSCGTISVQGGVLEIITLIYVDIIMCREKWDKLKLHTLMGWREHEMDQTKLFLVEALRRFNGLQMETYLFVIDALLKFF